MWTFTTDVKKKKGDGLLLSFPSRICERGIVTPFFHFVGWLTSSPLLDVFFLPFAENSVPLIFHIVRGTAANWVAFFSLVCLPQLATITARHKQA
jgi:hypothetical protein